MHRLDLAFRKRQGVRRFGRLLFVPDPQPLLPGSPDGFDDLRFFQHNAERPVGVLVGRQVFESLPTTVGPICVCFFIVVQCQAECYSLTSRDVAVRPACPLTWIERYVSYHVVRRDCSVCECGVR